MQRRLAAPLLLLFCTALTIVLLPYPASARVLGLFPSGSPSFSISHLGGPNAGSELPGTEWVTTTAGSGLDLSKIERMRQGNPKMGTSLNLLYDAYRDGGRSGAQQFAYQHLMVADGRRVQVEVTADVDAMAAIREAIEALGGEYQGHHKTLLQAMVPFEALGALAGQPQVWFVRQPLRAMPEEPSAVGAETSEGVDASNASAWHAAGYDGSGVKVAVVDSGFEGYAALLGTELPASVQTRDYTGEGMGGSEHGAGCAEIVHDMAPGADMYLYKVSTMVELSRAVDDLIAENVEIISMSLGWPIDGPGDGTGYLADIVNRARTNGIVFVKSAGNEAERSWSGRYQDSGNSTHRWSQQADVNAFGPEPGRCYRVDEGDQIRFALHWDDWTYVNQDYDLYLVRWTGSGWEVVQASTAYQDGRPGQEPTEMINILAPSEACYGAVVHRASATRDVCLRLSAKDSDGNPLVYTVPSRSLSFPGDSPDAFTVGAVDVTSPPAYPLEPYSSQGPTFGPGGACTGGALKPDIAAYARVSTDSYGPTGFAGTSAACPHVAGSSALVKQANPLYTVSDLQNFLEGRAIDQGPAGKDSMYGAGRLHLGPPPEAGTPTPTRTATPTRTGTPTRTPTPTETRPGMVWRTYLPVLLKDFLSAPPPVTATPTPSPTVPSGECVTILREDFEGPFPGPWDVGDLEPGEGEYYWSRSECRPYEGLYSGWAVGGGVDGASLPCGSDYPNNVDSEMTYGPFSLADAGAADLSLKVWLNTPWDDDRVSWAATDGQTIAWESRFGATDGWLEKTLDLSALAGQPQVWVTIRFISDRSGTSPEGAYVDNIVLRKCPSAPTPPTQTPTATPTATPPGEATPTATRTATRTGVPTATPTQPVSGWTTIVSEDFEGPFPGDWLLVDNRPGYGEYGWGKRDCRPYGGAYSGWAVGAGAQGSQLSCGSNYPDHAESWMVYGPFSLVDATAAELAFKLWLNTELDHDYIGYYASINGQNFYGWYRGGRDQQWDDAIFDLRDVYVLGDVTGQPEVWVALVFGSDDGRHFPEGCYVDDIVLRKCTSAQCAGGGGVVESQAGVTALGRAKRLRMPLPLAAQAMPPPSREAGDPQ